jgi:hypothetical protein
LQSTGGPTGGGCLFDSYQCSRYNQNTKRLTRRCSRMLRPRLGCALARSSSVHRRTQQRRVIAA